MNSRAGKSRRSQPLRSNQSSDRRTATQRKVRAKLSRGGRQIMPEQMFPEIVELLFRKYGGRPAGQPQCDWWAAPMRRDREACS